MRHWKYGGSTAKRQLNCPGWQEHAAKIPRTDSVGSSALVGTALHKGLEVLLEDPTPLSEAEISAMAEMADVTVPEMQELIAEKLLPAVAFIDPPDAHDLMVWTETELPHPHDAEVGGTTDVCTYENDVFTVLDYKTGDGKIADDFDQLMFYAYMVSLQERRMANLLREASTVNLTIVQAYRGEILTPTKSTNYAHIAEWGAAYEKSLQVTRKGGAPVKAGSWCRFCPAHPVCPAKKALVVTAMSTDVSKDLTDALTMAEELEEWIANVRKSAHSLLEEGQAIPGWKLVAKRATRRWVSTDKAYSAIESSTLEEAIEEKLRSPTQIQKLCKQQGVDYDTFFSDNVAQVSSGSTLAPESDPRKPVLNINSLKRELQKLES